MQQLRILKERAVLWTVKVQVPIDSDRFEEQGFKVRLRLLQDDAFRDDLAAIGLALAMPNGAVTEELVNQTSMRIGSKLEDAVLGWEGIVGEDETELPFTPENRRAVLNELFTRRAILRLLLSLSRGEAAEKN